MQVHQQSGIAVVSIDRHETRNDDVNHFQTGR